jgi:hypothetical protein
VVFLHCEREKRSPALGTNAFQAWEQTLSRLGNKRFPGLGTNAFQPWEQTLSSLGNKRFPALGTNVSMFFKTTIHGIQGSRIMKFCGGSCGSWFLFIASLSIPAGNIRLQAR